MDTKKLEALAAAVEYGSFTRAAENLGYTQSGLTHMMNSLEKDIGFPVLLRGRQGVRLTLEWVRLRDDPLLAILPPDYDLDGRHSFPVEGFSGEQFLMPSLGFHQDILRVMRGGGAEPVYRSPQVSDNVIISMVEHGLGLSILSELVLRGRQDDVLAVPLDPPAVREIGVAMRSRKEMPLMVRRFLNEARDMIETL